MPHTTPIEVRFSDIDKFNHVNNAVYLTYAEQARIHYFDEALGNTIDWHEKGLILAKAEANYIAPVVFHDNITIETICTKIGNKSITLFYRVFKLTHNKRFEMCNGETILVAFDYIKNESMVIPVKWRDRLKAFESSL
jgi:acyl-CoA thioester hydrolase